MKRLAVILAGSTLAMSGYAANWLEISKSQTGSIFSVDLDSIERSDIHIIDEKAVENITVSIRRTYPAPKTVVTKDSKEKDSKESCIPLSLCLSYCIIKQTTRNQTPMQSSRNSPGLYSHLNLFHSLSCSENR